jgi:single-strand DNA-binding protein
MSAPITITGNLVADPDLKFGSSGKAIAKFRVATSRRKREADGNWTDQDTTFWRCTAFGALAEHLAESAVKGTGVVVVGRAYANEWTTPEGDKRSQIEITADHVGIDLVRAIAKPIKAQSGGGGGSAEWSKPAPVDDVWGAAPAADDMPF